MFIATFIIASQSFFRLSLEELEACTEVSRPELFPATSMFVESAVLHRAIVSACLRQRLSCCVVSVCTVTHRRSCICIHSGSCLCVRLFQRRHIGLHLLLLFDVLLLANTYSCACVHLCLCDAHFCICGCLLNGMIAGWID